MDQSGSKKTVHGPPINGGVSLNVNNRPALVSQLHTPLVPRNVKIETENAPLPVGPSAVKRESSVHDPLGSHTRSVKDISGLSRPMELRSQSEASLSTLPHQPPSSPQSKNINTLTTEFMAASVNGEVPPVPLSPETVPQNLFGLNQLVQSSAWKHVVELSAKLLKESSVSSVSVEASLQDAIDGPTTGMTLLQKLRWEGLFHMKLFDELNTEISRLLAHETQLLRTELEDTLHEHTVGSSSQPIDGIKSQSVLQRGKRVLPMTIRRGNCLAIELVHAEVKLMSGHGEDAVEQLYRIRVYLREYLAYSRNEEMVPAQSKEALDEIVQILLWRITGSIINALIRQRFWRRVVSELQDSLCILRSEIRAIENDGSEVPLNLLVCEITLLCRLSRTCLQIGAMIPSVAHITSAKTLMETHCHRLSSIEGTADELNHSHGSEATHLYDHLQLAEGLVLFSQDKYEEAMLMFKGVLQRQSALYQSGSSPCDATKLFDFAPSSIPSNHGSEKKHLIRSSILGEDMVVHYLPNFILENESLMAAAASNLAICALSLRQLPRAIDTLEQLVRSNPARNMLDPVVFNLCTMYDLSCAPEVSTTKKKILQRIAVVYHVDDLHWRSFRLG
mmetsp:Transcript_2947/g.3106  ORF Transcript_2947/g.3106 Transcript_2947/m.3106 type:complete len:619 (-) Transcript_2947:87-1943(-)